MIDSPIKISRRITVGPQPTQQLLERLAKRGFKTIVNLSRKGELDQVFQPEEEKELVEELGMEYLHVPVSLSNIKDSQIEEFCQSLETMPPPAYVHCRIGQRAGPLSLIFHAMHKRLTADQVLEKGEALGLELQAPMIATIVRQYLRRKREAAGLT